MTPLAHDAGGLAPGALPDPLRGLLAGLRRRRLAAAAVAGTCIGVAAVLAGAGLLGLLDAAADLAAPVRAAAALVVAALLPATALAAWARSSRAATARALAAACDRADGTGGALLVGVELADMAAADPTSSALIARARNQYARRAEHVAGPTTAGPARRAAAVALGCAVGAIGAAMIWPQPVNTALARLLDPWGDHPLATPWELRLGAYDTSVERGQPFRFQVRVVRPADAAEGDRVEWQMAPLAGGPSQTLPLIETERGTWTGVLREATESFAFHVRVASPEGAERARSAAASVRVVPIPRIESVEVGLEFPAYTGLPPYRGPMPPGGPAGVAGTVVELTLVADTPLRGGSLQLEPDGGAARRLEMTPVDGHPARVRASFPIESDTRFEARVVSSDGHPGRGAVSGRAICVADVGPAVEIASPLARSLAVVGTDVPLQVEAVDEFGIASLELFRSLNGSPPVSVSLLGGPAGRRAVHRGVLPLAAWRLEAGDVLELYAVARDNAPGAGHTARTPMHRLRVISQEEYLEQLSAADRMAELARRAQELERLIEALRAEAAALPQAGAGSGSGSDARERLAKHLEAMREAAKRLERAAAEMPVLPLERELAPLYADLARRLAKAAGELERAAGTEGVPDAEALKRELEALDEIQRALRDGATLPAEVLLAVAPLMAQATRFAALAKRQDDLAKRALPFAPHEEAPDGAAAGPAMAVLGDEEVGIGSALGRILVEIRRLAGALPAGAPYDDLRREAEDFARAVDDSLAAEELDGAATALARGRGKAGHAAAAEAARILMEFVARSEGGGGMQGRAKTALSFKPSLSGAMQASAAALARSMSGADGSGGESSSAPGRGDMGMYGPRQASARRAGSGSGGSGAGAGGSGQGSSALVRPNPPDEESRREWGGMPMDLVPAPYRSAVRDYYRRVTEGKNR